MKKKYILEGSLLMAIGMVFTLSAIFPAWAEIQLWEDKLTLTGFGRYEVAAHVAGQNPNNVTQTENNDFNFSRLYLQTEWNFKPTETFKLFSKIRFSQDHTVDLDNNLLNYKAFPLDVPSDDWTLLEDSGDHWRIEAWELYTDVNINKLWLRLGKQQIVWGEMIASRLMDVINPLDFSRNLLFEPEEFDNIRIPNWSARARYAFGKVAGINDFSVEGFFNPGDVMPTQYPDYGSPFNLMTPFPPFMRITDKDRRGDSEFGFRAGGLIGDVYLTLNYLSLHSDEFLLVLKGIAPDPVNGIPLFAGMGDFTAYSLLLDAEYPEIEVYGLTSNYFIAPLNTVITFEGTYIPDQPYQDAAAAAAGGSSIKDQGTFAYAIRLDRQTFVLPTPTSAMMIQLQFNQTLREGDADAILGAANSKVDKTDETVSLMLDQFLHYNDYRVTLLVVYDLEDATLIKPVFRYNHGDHWYFDLYGVFLSGAEDRPGRFGGMDWADEIAARITYQF